MLLVLMVKVLSRVGALIGKGSSLPGKIALMLNPSILKKIKMPKTVIAVTGSNGKTGSCGLITEVLVRAGKKVVSNREGSNQKEGVATLLLKNVNPFTMKLDADVVVLESDERFCQYTFKDIIPSHIVINNLFRDQLTRNGHSEFVKGEVLKGLPKESVLILNANEPVSASCGEGRTNNIYYSVTAPELTEKEGHFHAYNDGAYCPVCYKPMTYSYRIAGQVGAFRCDSCGFGDFKAAHSVTQLTEDGCFIVDGKYKVKPQLANIPYAQNTAAVFTACVEAAGLTPEETAKYLDGVELANGRTRVFTLGGLEGRFILCKHENSMAYNGGIETAIEDSVEEVSVTFIVDRLSRKYVANDMSWLWDIDFERLNTNKVKKVFLCGGFAYDLSARLRFAGIEEPVLEVVPELDEMMRAICTKGVGKQYVFTCFTDQNKFLSRLAKLQGEQK